MPRHRCPHPALSKPDSVQRVLAAVVTVSAILVFSCLIVSAQQAPNSPPALQAGGSGDKPTLNVPAGTRISLSLVSYFSTKSRAGHEIYLQTAFPVTLDNKLLIPVGTYLQGTIEKVKRSRFFRDRVEVVLRSANLVFANGYSVPLPAIGTASHTHTSAASLTLVFEAHGYGDLLDGNAPVNATLPAALTLDADRVDDARSIQVANRPPLAPLPPQPQRTCYTPGTPGTPPTVIPGSPGTPPTIIPGTGKMPPTVIPGVPPSPPTVIPGRPARSGKPYPCP